MSRNTIIAGIVVLVLVALGAWYFSSSQMSPSSAGQATDATSQTTPDSNGSTAAPAKGSSTFKSIFTQSGSHECEYTGVNGSSQINSAIFIAGGKMRGEFRTMSGTNTQPNRMVKKGCDWYTWEEGSATGKKTSIKSIADLPQAIPQDLTSGAIYGTSLDNVGWDCHDWSQDDTQLVPPSYVKFSAV